MQLGGGQNLSASKVIRDPIHGYIHLDPLEEKIVNTKIFLRLRNIKQCATADQTYPSHHVDRFSHSLGVMELAGKMMTAGLNNSESSVVADFVNRCKEEFELPPDQNNEQAIPGILFRLARISGLLHDVGHLPFSHLSEGAVKHFERELYGSDMDYGVASKKLHEHATYKIIKENEEIKKSFEHFKSDYLRKLILKIFVKKPTGVFNTIKGIISGDVDADRADYMLRDGVTSGVGIGQYDQIRLFESMALCNNKAGSYLIRPTTNALSSVETFLVERHKLHKWVYYHQHVILTDQILTHLIRVLVKYSKEKDHIFYNFLPFESFHYSNYIMDDLPFDDAYIWNLLRKTYLTLKLKFEDPRYLSELSSDKQKELRIIFILLRILLFREKFAHAVWKSSAEYEDFDQEIRQNILKEQPSLKATDLPQDQSILNIYAKRLAAEEMVSGDISLDKKIDSPNYFILETERASFKPYEEEFRNLGTSAYFFINRKKNTKVPVTWLSPIVKNLPEARKKEMQLFVYQIKINTDLSENEWEEERKSVEQQIKKHLTEYYLSSILGSDH